VNDLADTADVADVEIYVSLYIPAREKNMVFYVRYVRYVRRKPTEHIDIHTHTALASRRVVLLELGGGAHVRLAGRRGAQDELNSRLCIRDFVVGFVNERRYSWLSWNRTTSEQSKK
jgi:hypothetical protein